MPSLNCVPCTSSHSSNSHQRTDHSKAPLLAETGFAFKPDRLDSTPLAYRMAHLVDQQQSNAEENRLLYVAATRAREKLIVSGHCMESTRGWRMDGWMKALSEVSGLDFDTMAGAPGEWHQQELNAGALVGAYMAPEGADGVTGQETEVDGEWPTSTSKPLYWLSVSGVVEELDAELDQEPACDWRATGDRGHPPASVVGRMVHRALQVWLFPVTRPSTDCWKQLPLERGLSIPASAAVRCARRRNCWSVSEPTRFVRKSMALLSAITSCPISAPCLTGARLLGSLICYIVRMEAGSWSTSRLMSFGMGRCYHGQSSAIDLKSIAIRGQPKRFSGRPSKQNCVSLITWERSELYLCS
ncbi:MAG: hypothetical protein PVG14_00540 [Anaerolineales bacterium]